MVEWPVPGCPADLLRGGVPEHRQRPALGAVREQAAQSEPHRRCIYRTAGKASEAVRQHRDRADPDADGRWFRSCPPAGNGRKLAGSFRGETLASGHPIGPSFALPSTTSLTPLCRERPGRGRPDSTVRSSTRTSVERSIASRRMSTDRSMTTRWWRESGGTSDQRKLRALTRTTASSGYMPSPNRRTLRMPEEMRSHEIRSRRW